MEQQSNMEQTLIEAIDTFGVSADEKAKCFKKAMITLNVAKAQGKISNGTRMEVLKAECAIVLTVGDEKEDIFHYIFDELKNPVIDKKFEMDRLVATEKTFQQDIKECPQYEYAMFYLHAQVNLFAYCNIKEFIQELKRLEESGEKLVLYDCNIKTCKINGRKYKRITFTNETHIHGMSKTEFCFGHVIAGWTYIVLPDKWTEMKEQVISLVDYKTTTYGSKTRYDLGGNEYKGEHND
jgi:hypothetical protein